jgi:hypothetical protein
MRLEISIDNFSHMIDSTDPDLLGKWVMEIFARAVAGGINPSTYIQVRAQSSWLPGPSGGQRDWITDSRITGESFRVTSPRDLLAGLSRQLDQAEAEALDQAEAEAL